LGFIWVDCRNFTGGRLGVICGALVPQMPQFRGNASWRAL
jgi:hypothetical protein